MDTNIRRLLKEIGAEDLIEVFAPCMDDYLYIIDLQKNTLIISQAAVKRFKMPGNSFDNAADSVRYFVYEEDRPMIREHLQRIADGNEIGNIQRADNISGLLGEREMHSFVSSHIKDSSSVFLIHIGIDGFNAINGTLGVDYGNYVLKSVADGIKECLSDNQQLYHLVADEYMIVDLESHTRDDVMLLQKEICKKIEDFIISEKYKVVFTVSTGIIHATKLLKYYDEYRKIAVFSLKQAKSMGGNGVYFFEKEDYKLFLKKEKIKSALRGAVTNEFEGFEVYYQPIIDCSSGNIIGAEALMRFSMYSGGKKESISPVEFIPLLEETGLIIPAGRFVLNEAAAMCHEMRQYIPGFKVNVNISYIQMMKSDIWKDILSSIE